jgi:predicted nucleic acid-binding protein
VGLTITDSSILIALIDSSDPCHGRAAQALTAATESDDILIPVVAFSEALVVPYRMGLGQGQAIESRLTAIGKIAPITTGIASRAAQLRAQRQIKLPDALIIATGMESNAQQILTFDARWKDVDRRVRVVSNA